MKLIFRIQENQENAPSDFCRIEANNLLPNLKVAKLITQKNTKYVMAHTESLTISNAINKLHYTSA